MEPSQIVIAIIPEYDSHGDGTTVLFNNGDLKRVKCKAKKYLQLFAGRRGINIQDLRSSLCGRRCFRQPLPIDSNHLFIPFKTRRSPIGRDDALGYINFHSLDTSDIKPISSQALMISYPQKNLTIYCSEETFQKKWREACHLHCEKMIQLLTSQSFSPQAVNLILFVLQAYNSGNSPSFPYFNNPCNIR